MSLAELLPDVRSLARADKLRVIQFLAQDLAEAEVLSLVASQFCPLWPPAQPFDGAETLLQVLRAERDASRCSTSGLARAHAA